MEQEAPETLPSKAKVGIDYDALDREIEVQRAVALKVGALVSPSPSPSVFGLSVFRSSGVVFVVFGFSRSHWDLLLFAARLGFSRNDLLSLSPFPRFSSILTVFRRIALRVLSFCPSTVEERRLCSFPPSLLPLVFSSKLGFEGLHLARFKSLDSVQKRSFPLCVESLGLESEPSVSICRQNLGFATACLFWADGVYISSNLSSSEYMSFPLI
jgi:hypothetical protein